MRAAIVDTSVWVAQEVGRAVDLAVLPERSYVSVVTLAELEAGVLAATDVSTRAIRLATVTVLSAVSVLPIDAEVAHRWAELRVRLRDEGRRVNVNDLWIAATALAHDLPVLTQDEDFEVLREVAGLQVVRA